MECKYSMPGNRGVFALQSVPTWYDFLRRPLACLQGRMGSVSGVATRLGRALSRAKRYLTQKDFGRAIGE